MKQGEAAMNSMELWTALHQNPELSDHEEKTMAILKEYLAQETDLEIHEEDGWMYGIHREQNAADTIAVRADMDAICGREGKPFHGCGHDGHMAMAAGAAASLKGRHIGRNVIFLFQPAEETGQGAKKCLKLFAQEPFAWIAGCHNIPGYPLGTVLLREDTFACASRGMIISLAGRQSHAGYPELGISPAPAAARLIAALPGILKDSGYRDQVLATIISVHIGERNFGISAGSGEVCLTIRARNDEDLQHLQDLIEQEASAAALADGVGATFSFQDEFPATVNHRPQVAALKASLREAGLSMQMLAEPMRWSEDFGWYLKQKPGVFFGIGSGTDCPGLHRLDYVFPTALLEQGIRIWNCVIRSGI
jgi:amidohydrolase